jgi:magnesium chelatase accessory protein
MAETLDWQRDGQDWPHAQASRFVPAGGLRWHVQLMGQGPALWLLHGTGAASHTWRDLLPRLARHYTVVAPDLPGHGFSTSLPARQQSMAGMARALGALAQALSLSPDAVAGHSAGAALALRACLDGLMLPRSVIGLNPALLPFDGPARWIFPPVARLLHGQPWLASLLAGRARDGQALHRLVRSTGSALDDRGLALYARLIASPGHVRGALAMMSDWDLASLQDDLCRAWNLPPVSPVPPDLSASAHSPEPATALPCLHLVTALGDSTVPPAQARRIAATCPGARLHELPGLGHLAHEEAPELFADLIERLLSPVSRGG